MSNYQTFMDRANYYGDPRVCERDEPIFVYLGDGCEGDIKVELPTRWEVCPVCNGAGKHVNPSVDCNGLTADDFAEDPDFYDDYMSGTYDVTCNKCNGRTTVRAVDRNVLTAEQRKAYEAQLEESRQARAEHLAELRMGA